MFWTTEMSRSGPCSRLGPPPLVLKQILSSDGFFVWIFLGETVEFLVNGSLIQPVSELLTQENVPFRIKIDDFQMVVEEQMRQIRDAEGEFIFRSPGDKPDPRKSFNKFNYHNLDDINNYIIQVLRSIIFLAKIIMKKSAILRKPHTFASKVKFNHFFNLFHFEWCQNVKTLPDNC